MKLYYFEDNGGNFGDAINPWFWSQVLPGLLGEEDGCQLLGIGTIINNKLPDRENNWVFGSGAGYGNLPTGYEQWRVYCVRGPLTARQMKLDPEFAVTDPAALCARIYQPQSGGERFEVSYIPHYMSEQRGDWLAVCKASGINYISPTETPLRVIDQIVRSDRVITEAMHGAILADAYRVPWKACSLHGSLNPKWQDWMLSLGLNNPPVVKLQQVWRGDTELPMGERMKNKLKRLLMPLKPASLQWTTPPCLRSPEEHYIRQAEELTNAMDDEFILSPAVVLEQKLDRLELLLKNLRTDIESMALDRARRR